MSYAQPSLFDQVYQQTFDFNRQAEQPRQQELNLSVENAKPTFENAKQLVRADKSCHKVNFEILLRLRFAPRGRAGAPRTPRMVGRAHRARRSGCAALLGMTVPKGYPQTTQKGTPKPPKGVPLNHSKGYPLTTQRGTL